MKKININRYVNRIC